MTAPDQLAGRRVYLDANVFVYALESLAPWDAPARAVLNLTEAGRVEGVTSQLGLAECLVKPLRDGNAAAARAYSDAFTARRGLRVVSITRGVLIEAARLRAAATPLKLPDAIHAATAALTGCDLILTNDAGLRAAGLAPQVLLLSEMTP